MGRKGKVNFPFVHKAVGDGGEKLEAKGGDSQQLRATRRTTKRDTASNR